MDTSRLRRLAGMDSFLYEELDQSAKELDELLSEEIHMGRHMTIDTDEVDMGQLIKRLNAARKGLGIASRLPSGPEKIKHFYRISSNMKTIEQALEDSLNQELDQEIEINQVPEPRDQKMGGM